MKELKLVSVLRTFSNDEIKEFEKFIKSPFHNTGRNFMPLYSYLKKYHPVYPAEKIAAERIYKKLYGVSVEDKQKISLTVRVLFSQLAHLAEKFLVHSSIEKNEYESLKISAGVYQQRHLYELCDKNILKSRNELIKKGIQSSYPDEMKVLNSLSFRNKMNQDQQYTGAEIHKYSPLYITAKFFLDIRPMLNNQINFSSRDDIPSLIFKDLIFGFDVDKFKELSEDDGSGTKENCILDYYICRLKYEENFGMYKLVSDEYISSQSRLSHFFKWSFFTAIFNLGYIKAHSVDYENYGKILLSLSSLTLDNDVYSFEPGGYLYAAAYEMIFNIHFGFVSGDELSEFWQKHIRKVKKDQRKYINRYSEAFIEFRKGHFESALRHISGLKPEAIIQKNILYRLKICCLIDAGYYDSASDTIESYARFLSGNSRVSRVIRKYGSNFLSGIRAVLRNEEKDSPKNINELTNAAVDNRNSHFGWWFKNKTHENKKGN